MYEGKYKRECEIWCLSESQRDYIKLLSRYPDIEKEDEEDINKFLVSMEVDQVEKLTKKEASVLITKLLERFVEYEFLCGLTKKVDKRDYNKYVLLGEMEACMHDCPDPAISSDVNNCPAFIKWHDVAQDKEDANDFVVGDVKEK